MVTRMNRQGYDLALTQYPDGWRCTFYTTGREHSLTSRTGSAWEPTAALAGSGRAKGGKPMRTVTILVVVLALLAVGALGWFLLHDPATPPAPTVSAPREIAPGVYSTKPAPWSREAQGSSWPILLLLWAPWPLLGAWAQYQRGGNWGQGLMVGLLFGPLGLLIANYSGGRRGPECRGRIDPKATRCRHCQIVLPTQ
jgi:hypothetical protein